MVDGDAAVNLEASGAEVEGATRELLLLLPGILDALCGVDVVVARRCEEAADDGVADEVIVSGEVENSDIASCSAFVVCIGMGRGRVTPTKSTGDWNAPPRWFISTRSHSLDRVLSTSGRNEEWKRATGARGEEELFCTRRRRGSSSSGSIDQSF